MGPAPEHVVVIAPEVAALVERKSRGVARRYRLPDADRADLRQDLLLAVVRRARDFDPTRGPAPPFVALVVDRHAKDCLAHRFARRRDPRRCAPLSEAPTSLLERRSTPSVEHVELRLDVDHALSTLSTCTQRVATGLKHGSVADVARWLRLTRGQVRHQLALLRRRLEQLGLGFEGRAAA